MPEFSNISLARLGTCDARLQKLFMEVIKTTDCAILEGHRDQAAQEIAFHDGKSEKSWPDSLHNRMPSLAVDVAPCPIRWDDLEAFDAFSRYVKTVADRLGIRIRCGADWKTFKDRPHFEVLG